MNIRRLASLLCFKSAMISINRLVDNKIRQAIKFRFQSSGKFIFGNATSFSVLPSPKIHLVLQSYSFEMLLFDTFLECMSEVKTPSFNFKIIEGHNR